LVCVAAHRLSDHRYRCLCPHLSYWRAVQDKRKDFCHPSAPGFRPSLFSDVTRTRAYAVTRKIAISYSACHIEWLERGLDLVARQRVAEDILTWIEEKEKEIRDGSIDLPCLLTLCPPPLSCVRHPCIFLPGSCHAEAS